MKEHFIPLRRPPNQASIVNNKNGTKKRMLGLRTEHFFSNDCNRDGISYDEGSLIPESPMVRYHFDPLLVDIRPKVFNCPNNGL